MIKNSWIEKFFSSRSEDLFEKCEDLQAEMSQINKKYNLKGTFALPLQSSLDREVEVLNPWSHKAEKWLCFDSNGYLGLQHHPQVKARVKAVIDEMGAGTPSVPLLGGSQKYSETLKETLCQFHRREAALIFSSGYSANCGVLSGLIRKNDAIVLDEKSHMSLYHGALLSKSRHVCFYKNNNMTHLESVLKSLRENAQVKGILVVTDGIFSMTGDLVPLVDFVRIAKKYGAKTLVDEAHSIGVVGQTGRGVEEYFNMAGQVDIIVGTFSKAFGFVGGYAVAQKSIVEYLQFTAAPWIFSTSLPACLVAGINEAIQIHIQDLTYLTSLRLNRDYLWNIMKKGQRPTPVPVGAIMPVLLPSNESLLAAVEILAKHRIKCGAVTFPAIKRGLGLLRIIPTTRHIFDDFDRLDKALVDIQRLETVLSSSSSSKDRTYRTTPRISSELIKPIDTES
jgi:7-keto-8-aminopelargonate synthetase-like enzyme